MRVRVFDDEAVVFNPCTWETHVLNAAATLALRRLHRGSCRHEDIARLLGQVLREAERPLAEEHARRLIQDLISLKLIAADPDAPDAHR